MQMDCDEVFPFSANFTSWPLLGSSGYKVKSLQSMWIDRIGQRGGGGGPALGMAESWLWDVWGGRVERLQRDDRRVPSPSSLLREGKFLWQSTADGWIVEKISLLANPNQVRPSRFWGVYTKLKIFNMTDYRKVVYLDADTIVLKNIEDLFKCSKFCANLKHSERLNSGVMVVEPSETIFNDMMSKVNTLPSYTGGDQGFLNSYYSNFPNAHVFEPNLPQEVRRSRPAPVMERLSTLYNADVGLYMLANKDFVKETLGGIFTSLPKAQDLFMCLLRDTLSKKRMGSFGTISSSFLLPAHGTLRAPKCALRPAIQVDGYRSGKVGDAKNPKFGKNGGGTILSTPPIERTREVEDHSCESGEKGVELVSMG
ncbi:inositol phosphorylceramide glucuronosyltransferase 1 [Cucumis melo var. makuwa]|uniref:Hexosyltransferase n=1 Tax=Cucumis melo var. makuwa TaxID=1194695 RepID=A0A5D3DUR3_CUCMM|nr:inositol phosphorylceramide glucuronosyltransferase 1 [Cucumis melo var. makuwa]